MKKFLAVFLGTAEAMDAWKNLSEEEKGMKQQQGMEAWMKWAQDNQQAIVESGSPLGKTKRVGKDGIADVRNEMGAWVVVQAETQEEAAKMFENHPHFAIFPGYAVDVMECLDMPKM